ncbi:RDD family protein [Altererythrobacter sp. SALINAS58]|uniref:RDD family protein n=1 Tax=Alteripontixanthobacter muriae TaxID=2705546 RepID=UPI0019D64131|nr:RDD family protein [Alteripontixanthobacter muriae]NTZ42117.1 RDD family protein [Alteripontixanthobacter muriae]
MASRVEASVEVKLAAAWPRFWARLLDIQLYSIPVAFVLMALFPDLATSPELSGRSGDLLIGFISLPFVMLVDAVILSKTGTSVGKALAALTLVTDDGELVPTTTALARNLRLYLQGLVLGIPLLVLIGYVSGYNSVKKKGTADWDEATGTRVISRDRSGARTWLVGVLAVFAVLIGNALARVGDAPL